MTESEFLAISDDILNKIEDQAESWFENDDIDVDTLRSGGVLTLTFNRSQQVVINSQAPFQQIWLAGPSGAYHYALRDGQWVDTRSDDLDLPAQTSKLCSELAGKSLKVTL